MAIDVGSDRHFVAAGLPDGKIPEEFNISHPSSGFDEFFQRIEAIEKRYPRPVAVSHGRL